MDTQCPRSWRIVHCKARVRTCGSCHVAGVVASLAELESPRQGEVAGDLHRLVWIPLIHQVILGPTI